MDDLKNISYPIVLSNGAPPLRILRVPRISSEDDSTKSIISRRIQNEKNQRTKRPFTILPFSLVTDFYSITRFPQKFRENFEKISRKFEDQFCIETMRTPLIFAESRYKRFDGLITIHLTEIDEKRKKKEKKKRMG